MSFEVNAVSQEDGSDVLLFFQLEGVDLFLANMRLKRKLARTIAWAMELEGRAIINVRPRCRLVRCYWAVSRDVRYQASPPFSRALK